MEIQKLDLSSATRDKLQDLLSTAKDEWKKYSNCTERIKIIKKDIMQDEEKRKDANRTKIASLIIMLPVIFFAIYILTNEEIRNKLPILLSFVGILAVLIFFTLFCNNRKKTTQSRIKKYEEEHQELQKEEEEAKSKFNRILNIPFKYWDDYALTTMLQYIEDYEASDWERVTDLYKDAEYRKMMITNAQMTLEEAKRQTEVALQTRNAARLAAFGSLISAAGILRINSKL